MSMTHDPITGAEIADDEIAFLGGPEVHRTAEEMNLPPRQPGIVEIIPGVQPQDSSTFEQAQVEVPLWPGHGPEDRAVPDDEFARMGGHSLAVAPDVVLPRFIPGEKPWATENPNAVPTYERSASDFLSGCTVFSSATTTIQITGRVHGRKSITLSVPTSYPNQTPTAIMYAPTQAGVTGGAAAIGVSIFPKVLNVGDSVTLNTEAPVWVAPATTGANPGLVQWDIMFNPLGGSLGSF